MTGGGEVAGVMSNSERRQPQRTIETRQHNKNSNNGNLFIDDNTHDRGGDAKTTTPTRVTTITAATTAAVRRRGRLTW